MAVVPVLVPVLVLVTVTVPVMVLGTVMAGVPVTVAGVLTGMETVLVIGLGLTLNVNFCYLLIFYSGLFSTGFVGRFGVGGLV